MQRRRANASRNIGSFAAVSPLALIGRGFGFSLHQLGFSPQRSRSRVRSPVSGRRRMTQSSWLGGPLWGAGTWRKRSVGKEAMGAGTRELIDIGPTSFDDPVVDLAMSNRE